MSFVLVVRMKTMEGNEQRAAEVARELAEASRAEPGCRAYVPCVASAGMRMRHHMLTALTELPPAPGVLRVAHEADTPWLARHAQAFAREARLPDRPEDVRRSVRRRVRLRGVRLWVDGAARVAFASVAIVGAADARIGLVYTLPRHRGRGYATTLVGAMVRQCLGAGVQRVFLVTDLDNPTSFYSLLEKLRGASTYDLHDPKHSADTARQPLDNCNTRPAVLSSLFGSTNSTRSTATTSTTTTSTTATTSTTVPGS